MGKLSLTAIFVILAFLSLQSQVDLNDNCTSAYTDIISLRFDDARVKLANEKSEAPENLMIPYLENYMDFLTVFIGENEEDFDSLEKNKSNRIMLIKQLDDTSRFKKYMLGNIHLQWAVARLKFKQYFTAAIEINKAYRLLEKNAEEFPDFIPNNISLGVLHIMIGMVPENYQWLMDLISMKGSVEQGREELYMVLKMSDENEIYRYLYDETLFYLGFVELNIHPDPEKTRFLLDALEQSNSTNLLLTYLQINILMKSGNNQKALSTFQQVDDLGSGYLPFHYLDYLQGECLLRDLNTIQAVAQYDLFLKNFKGRNYLKDAWRKKAWASLIDADTVNYLSNMAKVEKIKYDDVDIDKEADKEARSGQIPNVELIKARLLFDGGYYKRAGNVLAEMDTTLLNEEMDLERIYRKGRVAQESDELNTAKIYYLRTIEQGSKMKRYFAGNSALKLGEIYENEQNLTTALFYYNLCLDLDFNEYENSIHAKAKAAVRRLSE